MTLVEFYQIVADIYLALPAGIAGSVYGIAELQRRHSKDPEDKGPRITPRGVYARAWVKWWLIGAAVMLVAGHIFLRIVDRWIL